MINAIADLATFIPAKVYHLECRNGRFFTFVTMRSPKYLPSLLFVV
jgi:hypothetical protein